MSVRVHQGFTGDLVGTRNIDLLHCNISDYDISKGDT